MRNTKGLFIRLYIGTLYSNFIVPLRGSNYIQLLYKDLQHGLVFLFEQIRRLVWREHTNELRQRSNRLRALLNTIKVSLKCHHQNTTEIPPEITTERGQMSANEGSFQPKEIGSNRVKSGQKIGANRCESVQILTGSGTKMRANECECGRKIGTARDESGRKIGADWCKLVQKMRVMCDQMLPNATRKQGDQRRLKATKMPPKRYQKTGAIQVTKGDQRCPKRENITYQRLILLNSSFMLCC